jgi:hypothetical protein
LEFKDYYQTLGAARNVTTEDIEKAFRKLARKYHPDVSKELDAEVRRGHEAYTVLSDWRSAPPTTSWAKAINLARNSGHRRTGTLASNYPAGAFPRLRPPTSATFSPNCRPSHPNGSLSHAQ